MVTIILTLNKAIYCLSTRYCNLSVDCFHGRNLLLCTEYCTWETRSKSSNNVPGHLAVLISNQDVLNPLLWELKVLKLWTNNTYTPFLRAFTVVIVAVVVVVASSTTTLLWLGWQQDCKESDAVRERGVCSSALMHFDRPPLDVHPNTQYIDSTCIAFFAWLYTLGRSSFLLCPLLFDNLLPGSPSIPSSLAPSLLSSPPSNDFPASRIRSPERRRCPSEGRKNTPWVVP